MILKRTGTKFLLAPAAAALLLSTALPAFASTDTVRGKGTDAAGDAAPVYDLQRGSARFKTTSKRGQVTVRVSLAAEPAPDTLIAAVVGSHGSPDCLSRKAMVIAYVASKGKARAAVGDHDLKARARAKGTTVTVKVRSPKLSRLKWDCATFASGPETADVATDTWDDPLRLR